MLILSLMKINVNIIADFSQKIILPNYVRLLFPREDSRKFWKNFTPEPIEMKQQEQQFEELILMRGWSGAEAGSAIVFREVVIVKFS